MIYTAPHFSQAEQWPLQYFSPREAADTRTGEVRLWVPFGQKMDLLRARHGEAIFVNSWYRTPEHDRDIGGKGNHAGGWAADIRSRDMHKLLREICAMNFKGIGVAKSFIHVDDNEDYTKQGKRPALWIYG